MQHNTKSLSFIKNFITSYLISFYYLLKLIFKLRYIFKLCINQLNKQILINNNKQTIGI